MTDVIILGKGVAATALGSILARNGLDVTLCSSNGRPTASYCETTIPFTEPVFNLLAKRFAIPEFRTLSRHTDVISEVSNACGVKKNLGFIYHHKGEHPREEDLFRFDIPGEHAETHFYLPDLERYLFDVSLKYGVRSTNLTSCDVALGPDAEVRTAEGKTLKGRMLVDTKGPHSLVASARGWRTAQSDSPPSSRVTLHTAHLLNVKPYESCSSFKQGRWSAGTLHHIFEGGWMWVAPFGNHAKATNHRCSVGLSLTEAFKEADPDTAFKQVLSRFPGIATQFDEAVLASPWQSTSLPYASARYTDDHVCLLSQAAGGADELFSQGLRATLGEVYVLAEAILQAARVDDFSVRQFETYEQFQKKTASYNEQFYRAAYASMRHPLLWSAFTRVWLLGSMFATIQLTQAVKRTQAYPDPSRFDARHFSGGIWFAEYERYEILREMTLRLCCRVAADKTTASDAAQEIFRTLGQQDFIPPVFDFARPEANVYTLTPIRRLRTLYWLMARAPADLKKLAN